MKIKLDENLSVYLKPPLMEKGYDVTTTADEGLLGALDTEVAVIAMSEITKALTYFAADSDPGYPNADYLKNILIGAKEFGLPDYYLNDLAARARRAA